MKKHRSNGKHLETISEHANGLLAATAHVADEKVAAAREKLTSAMEMAKEFYENVEDNVVSGAKHADEFVHKRPYQAAGLALGVGTLIGFWLARRK